MITRRTLSLAALTVALSAVACSGGTGEPDECTDPQPPSAIRMEDFAFEPDCLAAEPGGSIHLENVGDAPHTFTVEGTDVSFDVPAGETAEGSLTGVEPGRYAVRCTYHPQMTATLTIEGQ
ncbi:MAG TPA: cupredoxin domain-containing protein [Actinomycetota bacterium]|nr:cupredoxin domain-containing protein [Actinomycetota bacterium]